MGVSMKTKGGMTAVLVSYDKYIENMQFIPTWKLGEQTRKIRIRITGYNPNVDEMPY